MNIKQLFPRFALMAVLTLLALPFLLGSRTALAGVTTLWVNDDKPAVGYPKGTSCDNPDFNSIQPAVNAAPAGATINVCAGTYTEQVSVPAGKNNLTLRSVTPLAAIIKAPPTIAVDMTNFKSIVRVAGAKNVTILAFTITGPGLGPCDSIEYGVRVDMNGSGNILGNHITEIHDTPFSGCQNGVAVLVGRMSEAQVATATIVGNRIDKYQKGGIVVSNVGSSAQVRLNQIQGVGPTATIAQNGIQVSGGANATVQGNAVSDNIYAPQAVASTGILLFAPGVVDVSYNAVTRNDVGIYLTPTSGATVSYNNVTASTFDGITLFVSNGNTVRNNKSEANGGPGIGVYDSTGNTLRDNEDKNNSEDGIILDNADNNSIRSNKNWNNGRDGIRALVTSTGNTIQNNSMQGNVEHDCHDDSVGPNNPPALVANAWVDNDGTTQNRPGLCRGAKDRDDDDKDDDRRRHDVDPDDD